MKQIKQQNLKMNQQAKFIVGGIGHRDLTKAGEALFVTFCFYEIINELIKQIPWIRGVSALAQGADTIFSECARQLSMPLEVITPFRSFETDFTDLEHHTRYRQARSTAAIETSLPFDRRCSAAYKRSMELVVFKSNLLMAAWDGQCIGSIGGTWDAIALCDKLGKNILHVDMVKRSTFLRRSGASTEGRPRDLISDVLGSMFQ